MPETTPHLEYAERICMVCDKEFVPAYPSQVTCGPECRKTRILQGHKEYNRKCRKQAKARLEALMADNARLTAELETARAEIERISAELEKCRQKPAAKKAETQPAEDAALALQRAVLKKRMKSCERMSLRATTLPCGQREKCFRPGRCEKCPPTASLETLPRIEPPSWGFNGF